MCYLITYGVLFVEIVEKVMKDMSRAFNLTMEKAKTIMTNVLFYILF